MAQIDNQTIILYVPKDIYQPWKVSSLLLLSHTQSNLFLLSLRIIFHQVFK